ncbi:hypothetical protein PoB_006412500 [Plakobranchus ocellatus]|uniref:Uncharacterized protein n=1 Tax=Plakobranchus ocellatus TaxID=259542 RepID=A0AAV4D0Q3_9GAST|nr:hypothetical protein PoB_006412500 [Plakobranchus ocellatus]
MSGTLQASLQCHERHSADVTPVSCAALCRRYSSVMSSSLQTSLQCHARHSADKTPSWSVRGTMDSNFSLRSVVTLLSRVRASPSTLWLDEGPDSPRIPCCGLAQHKIPSIKVEGPVVLAQVGDCVCVSSDYKLDDKLPNETQPSTMSRISIHSTFSFLFVLSERQ